MENNYESLAKKEYPSVIAGNDDFMIDKQTIFAERQAFINGLSRCYPLLDALDKIKELQSGDNAMRKPVDILFDTFAIAHKALASFPAKVDEDGWKELVKAQDDYIEFLDTESKLFVGFAIVHGMKVSERVSEKGQEHRENISLLKSKLLSPPNTLNNGKRDSSLR